VREKGEGGGVKITARDKKVSARGSESKEERERSVGKEGELAGAKWVDRSN
jgi:hypothetical protein